MRTSSMRRLNALLALLNLVLLAMLASGCAGVARLVSARVEIRAGTNVVTLVQPKDTTVRKLQFNPATGALIMEDYASAANPAAIEAARAQAVAQQQMFDRMAAMMELAMKAAARSQGIPIADPAAPAQ